MNFGTGGRQLINYEQNENVIIVATCGLAIQSDGKIVVGGRKEALRYTVDGIPDPTFGDNGVAFVDVLGVTFWFNAMTKDDNDRIILVGSAFFSDTETLAMARFTPSGEMDTEFNNGGARVVLFGDGLVYKGTSVGIDQNNNLIYYKKKRSST